jgi:hypothetical protein
MGGGSGIMGMMAAHPLMTGGLAAMLLSGMNNNGQLPADKTYTSPGLTPYKNRTYQAPPVGFQPGISPEASYFTPAFADGGHVSNGQPLYQPAPALTATAMNMSPDQILQRQMMMQQLAPAMNYAGGGMIKAPVAQVHIPSPNIQADQMGMHMLNHEAMRQGMPYPKPAALMKMANGGPIAGAPGISQGLPGLDVPSVAGDGSSDSIPATIDGQAPAMLSSGEHVIPADVVAHLGNGDSKSGSQQLHKMAARVRTAKTGKASLPARINPAQMLPA